ncbi:hypothetical protein WJX82_005986 [Trebouxia sp. C0006]
MSQAAGTLRQQVSALLTLPGEAEVHAYHEQVLLHQNSTMTICLDSGSGKGKGVFAHTDIQDEQTILQEAPLVAGQHTSNKAFALVCSHCFHFLGSIRMQLAWCKLAALCNGTPPYGLEQLRAIESQLHPTPFSEQWQMPQPVACPSGCQDEVYCSQHCATAAWVAHHSILCCQATCPRTDRTQKALQQKRRPAVASMHLAVGVIHPAVATTHPAVAITHLAVATMQLAMATMHLAVGAMPMREFREHADNTNDIFLVAAQAVAHSLITALAALASGGPSNLSCWEALLKGWQPYRMGWKKLWWECVACPEDVEDEQAFRQELKDLAQESLSLLRAALFDERFAALFELDVYGSIVGMFELNNLGIMSPSPVQEYIEAIDDLPDADKSLIAKLDMDTEELCVDGVGTQSCEHNMSQQQRSGSGRHRRTVHREAPSIDVSSRRAAEESAWRIKSVKLERDRHAQQRHLNPLNMADTIGHLVASFKGKHRDAILVIGEDTLEVFVETPEAAAPTKKLKKGLSKVFGRKDSDSDGEAESVDAASGVGETEEALDGHLFSVGVAFAQILQLSQHDKAITVYYHPNSFSSTQSIRSNLASCWRFTVALDTPEEADSVMADIRLQLARYAQGIHWVQKNFLLDESISAVLITAGPMPLRMSQQATAASSRQSSHVVLQMQPDFNTPFPAPESWNQQAGKGEVADIVRVFLQTPTGSCHVDITKAILKSHLQGDRGHFYVNAVAKPVNKDISLEALERRKAEIDKYLVRGPRSSHRLSLSHAGSFTTQIDDTSTAPTPRHMHGGFAFSDKPILGGPEDLARSRSFSGQERKQMPTSLNLSTGRDDDAQEMRRVNSWSSLTGSPKKAKPGKGLTILADTEAPVQPNSAGSPVDRDLMATKRLGSVRFAADHLQPDSPSGLSLTGQQQRSPRAQMLTSAAAVQVRLHCRAQRVPRQSSRPQEASSPQGITPQASSSSQLRPLSQLAAQQPHQQNDDAGQTEKALPSTQIVLTLLGAEITDSMSAEETGDLYDDDASEISLEVGAEAGPEFETHVQERLQSASVAQSGPTTDEGVPSAVAPQHSSLRRFSKDHAVSDDIQKRFMIAVEDDDKAAKKRVQEWLEWKTQHGLANGPSQPQPHYEAMKKAIMHAVICFSKSDHPIRIMKVGDMRASWKKMKAAGITSDIGLRHFGFVEEYIWHVLDPRPLPLGTAIWIVDLGGMGLSDLGSEAFQFFKRMSVEVGMHYPERLYKLVLLNAPSFFSLLWRICEPIMPGSTRNKVKVVRSHQELIAALADECDAAQIPSDYGGTAAVPLYDTKIEKEMREYVQKLS